VNLNVNPSGIVSIDKESREHIGVITMDGKEVVTRIIGEEDANELFNVYPNPSNGLFNIELSNEDKAAMLVTDITGKVIRAAQLNKNERYTLDLSGYSKGMYFIKMSGKHQQFKKIILE
jgi:hypothetical protein